MEGKVTNCEGDLQLYKMYRSTYVYLMIMSAKWHVIFCIKIIKFIFRIIMVMVMAIDVDHTGDAGDVPPPHTFNIM